MKSNKECGFYTVEYSCLNCGEKVCLSIEYGKSIPILVYPFKNDSILSQWHKEAPECEYCGCRSYTYGKRPKY